MAENKKQNFMKFDRHKNVKTYIENKRDTRRTSLRTAVRNNQIENTFEKFYINLP